MKIRPIPNAFSAPSEGCLTRDGRLTIQRLNQRNEVAVVAAGVGDISEPSQRAWRIQQSERRTAQAVKEGATAKYEENK